MSVYFKSTAMCVIFAVFTLANAYCSNASSNLKDFSVLGSEDETIKKMVFNNKLQLVEAIKNCNVDFIESFAEGNHKVEDYGLPEGWAWKNLVTHVTNQKLLVDNMAHKIEIRRAINDCNVDYIKKLVRDNDDLVKDVSLPQRWNWGNVISHMENQKILLQSVSPSR